MPSGPTETRVSPAFGPLVIRIPRSHGSTSPAVTVYFHSTNMKGVSRSAASPLRPWARPVPWRTSQEWTP